LSPRDASRGDNITHPDSLPSAGKLVIDSEFKVQGSRFEVQGSKVPGSRFWVQGSGFKVQSSKFKVTC